jgi:DNA-directed RNA polymerase subunit RPC12/RpoP
VEGESRWACPNCGAHRLALEELPNVGALGAQPLSDLIGMGDPIDRPLPRIVCLNCGRQWPNPEAVWAEAEGASSPGRDAMPDGSTPDAATLDPATPDAALPDESR